MAEKIKKLLKDWEEARKLTLDLLDSLPEENLEFTVNEKMGTIGKQYRHIGDVQLCYVEGIKIGKVDFDKYKRDYAIESSKIKLKTFLEEVNQEMLEVVEQNYDVKIDWFGEEWTLEQHIRALIEHEILHQGELIVYVRVLGIKFPKSWGVWGL